MFSAILGLVGTGISAMASASAANQAAQLKAREMEQTRKEQIWNKWLAGEAMDQQQAENDYRRQVETMNRGIAEDERTWSMQQYLLNSSILSSEYQQQISRQVEMDREAARLQAFQIQQYMDNRDLAAEERQWAIDQFNEAKATAAGERDEDLQRFYQEQALMEAEREWSMTQYGLSRDALMADRQRDLEMDQMLRLRAQSLQGSIQEALSGLGSVPEMPHLTQADLDNEIARRQELYQSDVDRAATRIGSVNEANLIRAGVDAGTTGTGRRAEITREVADAYTTARGKAYDDALAYITGQQDFLQSNYTSEMQRRGDVLSEVLGSETADLDILMNLPQIQGLQDLTSMAAAVPSAQWSRQIVSANNFNAPVPIGSAVDNSFYNIGPAMSNYQVSRSAVNPSWANVPSQIFDPYSQNLMDPAPYVANSGNLQQSLLSDASASYQNALDRQDAAWADFGGALGDFASQAQDTWFAPKKAQGSALTTGQPYTSAWTGYTNPPYSAYTAPSYTAPSTTPTGVGTQFAMVPYSWGGGPAMPGF